MASTTLVTFLFDCPTAARTVELLGSWDNFSKPYILQRDPRRGPNFWSGCYTFENIICDGDFDNIGNKRDGALKMGGTYWYYYKVNDDDEHHDPSQPSTTFCPLLPGQRLNILDVPTESRGRSRSISDCDTAFTRNPGDKFVTPVPPKPLPSPRSGDYCKVSSNLSMHPSEAPRTATYPSPMQSLSPGYERHTRSASASPRLIAGGALPDFRGLKEKIATSKRSRSRTSERTPQRWNAKDIEISAPTLISTTAEEMELVPLPSLRSPFPTSSPNTPAITAKLKQYSPLRSHPVDPLKDFDFGFADSINGEERASERPRSDVVSTAPSHLAVKASRARANSSETRRTEIYAYPNAPWLCSPGIHQSHDTEEAPMPVLPKPASLFPPTNLEERPPSRNGASGGTSLSNLMLDKELPKLPQDLTPAPRFACNGSPPPMVVEDLVDDSEDEVGELIQPNLQRVLPRGSHFSEWSTDSMTFSAATIDEDVIYSPTFSSLASNSSNPSSPQRLSVHSSFQEPTSEDISPEVTDSPPFIKLGVPSFGPSLFQIDIQRPDSAPRRQAACFGLSPSSFQGYSLPEDETTPQSTITKSSPLVAPSITSDPHASVSQVEKLMTDFGYLGDAVL